MSEREYTRFYNPHGPIPEDFLEKKCLSQCSKMLPDNTECTDPANGRPLRGQATIRKTNEDGLCWRDDSEFFKAGFRVEIFDALLEEHPVKLAMHYYESNKQHIESKKDFQNIFNYFSKYPNPDRYKEQTYKEQYNELFRRRFPGIVIKELLIKRLKTERFSPEEFVEIFNEDRSFHLEVFDALLDFNGTMAMKYYDSKENSIGSKEQYESVFDRLSGKIVVLPVEYTSSSYPRKITKHEYFDALFGKLRGKLLRQVAEEMGKKNFTFALTDLLKN